MTCVVAVSNGRQVVMGADTAAGSLGDPEMHQVTMPKVFRAGPYLVGYSSSFRLGQVLWKEMVWPKPPEALDYEFMIKTVVRALDKCLSEQVDSKHLEGLKGREWQFILAYKGDAYGLTYKYDVLALEYPYLAIGAGRKYAYGALHMLSARDDLSLRDRAVMALEAACMFTPGLRGPFLIESTDPAGLEEHPASEPGQTAPGAGQSAAGTCISEHPSLV